MRQHHTAPNLDILRAQRVQARKVRLAPNPDVLTLSPPSPSPRELPRGHAISKAAILQPGYPGTILKRELSWLSFQDCPTCECNEIAALMDEWGPDICEQQMNYLTMRVQNSVKIRKANGCTVPSESLTTEKNIRLALKAAIIQARAAVKLGLAETYRRG